jgi:hypothetical protein
MISRTSAFALICVVTSLFASDVATACSCISPKGTHSSHVKRTFENSSAVFSARVTRTLPFSHVGDSVPNAELLVLQVWKGPLTVGATIEVFAFEDGASCNRGAVAGQELMIYVFGPPPYELTHCSLTGHLADSARDLPLLDKLSKRYLRTRAKAARESPKNSLERTRDR